MQFCQTFIETFEAIIKMYHCLLFLFRHVEQLHPTTRIKFHARNIVVISSRVRFQYKIFVLHCFYLSGIGKFIALDFARRGARVILACRSEARGTAALKEIQKLSGNENVHLRLLDTSSLNSVRKFAAQILAEEKELHILVNNAGASGGNNLA